MDNKVKRDNSELFKWDGKPSFGQMLPLAAQHVLAAVVGCVTPVGGYMVKKMIEHQEKQQTRRTTRAAM